MDILGRLDLHGNGMVLLEKTNQSIMSSAVQEKRIVFTLSKDGNNKVVNDVSSGMLVGIKNFYDVIAIKKLENNKTRTNTIFNIIGDKQHSYSRSLYAVTLAAISKYRL